MVRDAQVQRDAVIAIESNRGTVRYNGEHILWDAAGTHMIPPGETWAPRWLVDFIGVDYFNHISEVYLQHLPGGADMVAVGRLSSVKTLGMSGTNDSDLENLKGLTKLSSLQLFNTRTTDAGLLHLTGLSNLSKLGL
jgi:hypothetical protein